jgi:hypothetical protein
MNDNEKLKNLMIKSTNTRKNMDRGDSDGSWSIPFNSRRYY